MFRELGLCTAIGCADAFQISVFEALPYFFINDIYKFRDIRFMKCIVHILQIIKGENLEDVTKASCRIPLVIADRPADPIFTGSSDMFLRGFVQLLTCCLKNNIECNLNSLFPARKAASPFSIRLLTELAVKNLTKSSPGISQELMA